MHSLESKPPAKSVEEQYRAQKVQEYKLAERRAVGMLTQQARVTSNIDLSYRSVSTWSFLIAINALALNADPLEAMIEEIFDAIPNGKPQSSSFVIEVLNDNEEHQIENVRPQKRSRLFFFDEMYPSNPATFATRNEATIIAEAALARSKQI